MLVNRYIHTCERVCILKVHEQSLYRMRFLWWESGLSEKANVLIFDDNQVDGLTGVIVSGQVGARLRRFGLVPWEKEAGLLIDPSWKLTGRCSRRIVLSGHGRLMVQLATFGWMSGGFDSLQMSVGFVCEEFCDFRRNKTW